MSKGGRLYRVFERMVICLAIGKTFKRNQWWSPGSPAAGFKAQLQTSIHGLPSAYVGIVINMQKYFADDTLQDADEVES